MSASATVVNVPQQQESKYKSLLKPVRFWQRNNKTGVEPLATSLDKEEQVPKKPTPGKLFISSPSFNFKKQPAVSTEYQYSNVALREASKEEVYKLSTIDDSGIYMPPSPDVKRDHWLDLDEDIMAFRLPSSDCLTTKSGQHEFYTPSVIVNNLSRVSTESACDDDIPSLLTDASQPLGADSY
ncbi:hypothetical protein EC973_003775 [Apophysomyces ossiformis]|uniref:Uncharacterized protein n=1 Tax=Apophysomyces ossiformis TaxID=679940 RepID=A0A8H7BGR6_9FUNG|nr:hypothetical protein EC973_003775 [Apophysomyces ossiformis]